MQKYRKYKKSQYGYMRSYLVTWRLKRLCTNQKSESKYLLLKLNMKEKDKHIRVKSIQAALF